MQLVVDRYELGVARTNCYVLRGERGAREAIVVDPGDDATTLRLELARMHAECGAIFVTHADVDHVGAVADLAEATGARVYAPPRRRMPKERADGLGWYSVRDYEVGTELEGGESIEAAGVAFDVVAVPGHSPDHVAFAADGALFSGDLVFAGSVGRVDLPGGDWETLLESTRALAERFPAETTIYPGHGPPTTLGAELARNPYLAELRT